MSPLQCVMLQWGAASHMSIYAQLMQSYFPILMALVPEKTLNTYGCIAEHV